MTKIRIVAIAAIVIISFCNPINRAKALDHVCTPGYVSELIAENGYTLKPYSAVKITAEKTGPNYVVVIGQDPEKTGVSIKVTITSVPGQLEFDTNELEAYCDGPYDTYSPDPKKSTCGTSKPYQWYYWSTKYVCVPHTGYPAYRLVRDVRIWLIPSKATSDWLGSIPITGDGRFGLNYIYPEQWMVGNWNSGGFTTQGTYTGMNDEFYQGWLSQMQGYNFLAGSGDRYNAFLSGVLTQVPGPLGDGVTSLGL